MKYIVFLIVVCSFLPARGQTIYGRTMAGLPKMEYAPDKQGIIVRGELVYHDSEKQVISEKRYKRLMGKANKYGTLCWDGSGDTLNMGLRSYCPSLYKGRQLPVISFEGMGGHRIEPGKRGCPVILAFWQKDCCGYPEIFLNTLDSIAGIHPEVEVVTLPFFPESKEWVQKQIWKNLEVIPDYHDEYDNCFCTGGRLLVIADRTGKIKEYYVGPTFRRLERINKFIKRYIEKH